MIERIERWFATSRLWRHYSAQAERHARELAARHGRLRDPVTGEAMTLTEEWSFFVQSLIRRWTFLGLITAATLVVWGYAIAELGIGLDEGAHALTTWWNLLASYAAILIESVVGIGLWALMRREVAWRNDMTEYARRQLAHSRAMERHFGVQITEADIAGRPFEAPEPGAALTPETIEPNWPPPTRAS